MSASIIPDLPSDALREAVDAGDWNHAMQLLTAYDGAVRAWVADPAVRVDRVECMRLLQAQQQLQSGLERARDAAASALQQMQRDRRGVQAYLGSAA